MKIEPRNPFVPRAPHHLYMGLMIMFLGWTMQENALYNGYDTLFLISGGLIALDDIIEHTITRSTPLHWFFDKVIIPFLMKVELKK